MPMWVAHRYAVNMGSHLLHFTSLPPDRGHTQGQCTLSNLTLRASTPTSGAKTLPPRAVITKSKEEALPHIHCRLCALSPQSRLISRDMASTLSKDVAGTCIQKALAADMLDLHTIHKDAPTKKYSFKATIDTYFSQIHRDKDR